MTTTTTKVDLDQLGKAFTLVEQFRLEFEAEVEADFQANGYTTHPDPRTTAANALSKAEGWIAEALYTFGIDAEEV